LFFRRSKDSDDIFPADGRARRSLSPMFPNNAGLREKASARYPEEIVVLGEKAYQDAVTDIETMIGTLQEIIVSEKRKIERLEVEQEQKDDGDDDRIAEALWRNVDNATKDIKWLNKLHSITKFMSTPRSLCIGPHRRLLRRPHP
jgi:uncharacterized small protein (DUF1192 family)